MDSFWTGFIPVPPAGEFGLDYRSAEKMLSRFLALPLVVRETLLWHTAKRQLLETSYEYETCPVLSAPGVAQISAEARCVEGARETLLDSAAQHTVPIFSMLGTKRTVSAGFLEAVL